MTRSHEHKPLLSSVGEGRKVEPGFDVSIRKTSTDENRDEGLALQQLSSQLPGALDKLDLTDQEIETLRKAIQPGPVTESVNPMVMVSSWAKAGTAKSVAAAANKQSRFICSSLAAA